VARELNSRVTSQVLDPLDKTKLKGKTATIYGTFTLRTFNLTEIDVSKITIVPVKIDLAE
jgi:predicted lipoprotein